MRSEPTHLYNKNTHNSQSAFHWCTVRRPCHREISCKYCFNRKLAFITKQVLTLSEPLDLNSWLTISVTGYQGTISGGYVLLSQLRKKLFRRLFASAKYLSVIVVADQPHEDLGEHRRKITPHWHIITDRSITHDDVKTWLLKFAPDVRFSIHLTSITDTRWDRVRLTRYIIRRNYRKALVHRPKGMRVLTGSSNFKTGRPKNLKRF